MVSVHARSLAQLLERRMKLVEWWCGGECCGELQKIWSGCDGGGERVKGEGWVGGCVGSRSCEERAGWMSAGLRVGCWLPPP